MFFTYFLAFCIFYLFRGLYLIENTENQHADNRPKGIEENAKAEVSVSQWIPVGVAESEIEHVGDAVLEATIDKEEDEEYQCEDLEV